MKTTHSEEILLLTKLSLRNSSTTSSSFDVLSSNRWEHSGGSRGGSGGSVEPPF